MAVTYTVQKGDTLNGIAQKYGFKNYRDAGISSVPSGNFDLIRPGETITLGAAAAKGTQPVGTNTSPNATGTGSSGNKNSTATTLINQNQDKDMEDALDEDGPRSRGSIGDYFDNLNKTLTESLGERPDAPSLAERFQELRGDSGVSDLETRMEALKAEERDLQAIKRQRVSNTRQDRVAEGVIAGRVSTIERQENERIDTNLREQAYIGDQLNTKYNVINMLMGFEQTDYQNASQAYDARYKQVVDTINLARGVRSDDLSEQERDETAARANLQIMYNALSSGDADFDTLDPAAVATITKLEAQSGLPIGFYQSLKSGAAKNAEIVSTSTRQDSSGSKYADIVMRNADGTITVQSQYLGKERLPSSGGSGDMSESAKLRQATAAMSSDLNTVTGEDGFISPADYKEAKARWISVSGYSGKEFDEAFSAYANPDHLTDYGLKY